MRKGKSVATALVAAFLLSTVLISNVFAGNTGGGRNGGPPPCVPEPISCTLLLVGGATLAAVHRWKNRKNSKDLDKHNVE